MTSYALRASFAIDGVNWSKKTPAAKWMLSKGHTRSISRRLFARMIALYAHHDLQDKVIDVIQLSFVLMYTHAYVYIPPEFLSLDCKFLTVN